MTAHAMVGGRGRGRRTQTQSINWSLVLILASEFQGYVREVHDEAAEFLAGAVSLGNYSFFTLVRNNLTVNRQVDRVNAKSATLKVDFDRFGFDLWSDICSAVASGQSWKEQIDRLNEARNSIAHNDLEKLKALSMRGYPLNLVTIRSWRSACNGVARHIDISLGKRLSQLAGVEPW
jgi:hypothetical protein